MSDIDLYEELVMQLEEAEEKGDVDRAAEIELEIEEIVEKDKHEDT